MEPDALDQILNAIDDANAEDPNTESDGGGEFPAALLYGRRMSAWIARLRPGASAELQIAARAQHIRRWRHPRDEYPMDRRGYLAWRRGLYSYHAAQAGDIMAEFGADPASIDRVSFLLHKKKLQDDPETQALEDAACLVFLQHHIDAFAAKTDHEKMVNIVRKTWGKMSEQARGHALELPYSDNVGRVLQEALGDG